MLSFHRSQTILVKIQKPDETRAFVFDVQMGLAKSAAPAVDPQSGMLLNLVKVDPMLTDLAQVWASESWHSLGDLLQKSQNYLSVQAKNEGVVLNELCLREKRGFWMRWSDGRLCMGREALKELDGMLYKISWERAFFEETLEDQEISVGSAKELFSDIIFQKNSSLDVVEVENLATSEKWSFLKGR
ncbi:hypothetical protein [Bdellovibrio sp. HCB337]|uniref:hypothetical protein n=1 Tax=Bdellovibrio sp. HCB337 TaxID=3394358 RepID=UPI0039A42F75